jgi:hypothetical protein
VPGPASTDDDSASEATGCDRRSGPVDVEVGAGDAGAKLQAVTAIVASEALGCDRRAGRSRELEVGTCGTRSPTQELRAIARRKIRRDRHARRVAMRRNCARPARAAGRPSCGGDGDRYGRWRAAALGAAGVPRSGQDAGGEALAVLGAPEDPASSRSRHAAPGRRRRSCARSAPSCRRGRASRAVDSLFRSGRWGRGAAGSNANG